MHESLLGWHLPRRLAESVDCDSVRAGQQRRCGGELNGCCCSNGPRPASTGGDNVTLCRRWLPRAPTAPRDCGTCERGRSTIIAGGEPSSERVAPCRLRCSSIHAAANGAREQGGWTGCVPGPTDTHACLTSRLRAPRRSLNPVALHCERGRFSAPPYFY